MNKLFHKIGILLKISMKQDWTFANGPCPHCGAAWVTEAIPYKDRKHYNPPYLFGRVIGIEYSELYDGVSYWQCPDCSNMFDRWTHKRTSKTKIRKMLEEIR